MKVLVAGGVKPEEVSETAPLPQTAPVAVPLERSAYAPPASSRIFGLTGTIAIFAMILVGLLLTIDRVVQVQPPSAPTMVELLPLASPPETPPEEKEAQRQVEKKIEPSEPPKVQPIEQIIVPIQAVSVPQPVGGPNMPDPARRPEETTALKTAPAPPAPQVSSNAPDTWEGRVLAQLNKHRRYPRMAMARRQQGVPYIRFTVDREGKVLSSHLERSSGNADLDREAVALPKRASPLPRPPVERNGETLELVVPVEFFMK
ncbi:energy transducer TonB [Sphingobium sp. SCG-1]|uniref:energy transducer TonB family protein n=1 Tax=Sphingobium sp. SCG-1 TaxID=2072936 RepID=UPI000CD6C44E|nr:energy transducer TonB [Sphingobium sp. SCG-1]AUW57578.1 energy transducer TonB [Sphingobium sp. SCG-1]